MLAKQAIRVLGSKLARTRGRKVRRFIAAELLSHSTLYCNAVKSLNKIESFPSQFPSYLAGTKLTEDQEARVQSTLQEFLIYLIFLLDLSILTFGMVNYNMYFFTKVMSQLFLESTSYINGINFNSINSMANFWEFVEGPMLRNIYWKEWYNGKPLYPGQSYIFYESILLGRPQVRQLRVRNNTCSVNEYFKDLIKDCYNEYSFHNEDQSPFGLKSGSPHSEYLQIVKIIAYFTDSKDQNMENFAIVHLVEIQGITNKNGMTTNKWKYSAPNHEFELWHWGKVGTYRNGGYIIELEKNKPATVKIIKYLKSKLWLDHGTRAVFVDFSVYNANVNLFCAIRLLVEFPASGGAVTSSEIYTVKLLRYVSKFDYFLAVCEVIFCVFIFNYVIQEGVELYCRKLSYFKRFWNFLDFSIVLLSIVAIFFNIYRTIKVNALLLNLLKNSNSYPNLYFLAYWQNRYNIIIAFTVFIAWIKIFKYISFNMTMTQLATTLSRCAKAILGFAVMFFIVFFGYAQLGYLIFGTQVDGFHTFGSCIFTQFRIILGDFNFSEIEEANRILGPIYFITFVFCLFFVLLNVFLAIINDTYSEVKDDKSLENVDFDIYEVLKRRYKNLLYKINPNMFPPVAHPTPGNKNAKESQTALQHDSERRLEFNLPMPMNMPHLHESNMPTLTNATL
ncbi:polycystic kidney disease 2-like 2 protein [Amblyraja radiata]|uniref:polycystic kidney disease 2-like 2 protein n=1 Tax=Amblyraja radiata TaxID=386614 RepID=UPI001403ADAC|nr:polycystic kidney disease 2-like 2 protein [Amblyraja radiata]